MRRILVPLMLTCMVLEFSLSQSPSNILFELDRMQFNTFLPGAYLQMDRYIAPEDTVSALNYFLHTALWVGAKSGNTLSVISGDGNPTIKEFPEWQFTTNTYQLGESHVGNSTIATYRSVYNDHVSMVGHTPIGISVQQTTYEWKGLPALIFKYTVSTEIAIDSLSIGKYFDFDIPEEDNRTDAYNDQVWVDPERGTVFMSNQGEWENGVLPAVVVLSEPDLYCRVSGSQTAPLSDAGKWNILKTGSIRHEAEIQTEPDDYRFVVHSGMYSLSEGDSVSFVLALIHTKGIKKSKKIVKRLQRWYGQQVPLGRRALPEKTDEPSLPGGMSLSENYPNPFNSTTQFHITLPEDRDISISIYDVSGKLVKTLFTGTLVAGTHTFTWNGLSHLGKDVASGIYFLEAEGSGFRETRKILLIR